MAIDKRDIVRQLISVFRQYGYEGATLSRISTATGLGRASLYHHFPDGKEGMAEAVLKYVNECFDATVLAPLRRDDTPAKRLTAMSESLNQFYNRGQNACFLSIFSIGEGNNLFHTQVQHALKTWIDQLTQVFMEAGFNAEQARERAEDAVIQIQGALVVTQGLSSTEPFERTLQHLPNQLLTRP